ncbi:MAG: DCC1-like thiol-disulfide oxidoreductase family protein [Thermoplasmata archaeon]
MSAEGAFVFYDGHCGPCSFFARAVRGLAIRPVSIRPLTDPAADAYLGQLTPEARHNAFHLWKDDILYTGVAAVGPLVGAMCGDRWAYLIGRIPPLDRGLRSVYVRFWRYRRTHGCAV